MNAVMLHPTKNEDGEITDVTATEAILHFLSVGWKVLFAFCPPPHYCKGVPCFFVALTFIGVVTAVVGEVATAVRVSPHDDRSPWLQLVDDFLYGFAIRAA